LEVHEEKTSTAKNIKLEVFLDEIMVHCIRVEIRIGVLRLRISGTDSVHVKVGVPKVSKWTVQEYES